MGSENVYFQPPENIKLKYPCILYEFNNIDTKKADNDDYLTYNRYAITFITRDPNNETWKEIQKMLYCSIDRVFVSDNLYHYVFTLFY